MDESMQFIDLHTHSQASDGTDSPGQLVRNAHAQGLAAVAVTDHDTVSGLDEAEAAGTDIVDVTRDGEPVVYDAESTDVSDEDSSKT